MIYRTLLQKMLLKIPGVTVEEADMVVDSIIEMSETNFKDAIKDMATKSDIKDMATKSDVREATKDMATKSDVREATKDMATKDDIREATKDMATKSDIREIKSDLKDMATKSELSYFRWAFGLLFIINAAIFVKLFF